ncbi:MAG: cation:proton antiporter subunit C [Methanocellales archaeon]|nr:cation:proton antiporter subunit C [Methanocellales archaeon]MDD3290917.1 cation:proton antiporter subunit C [Methanocellales archaeon]MDD3292339.1 cation:proton antiporter subunit C [Methanocellales archaeon]MDD5234802.1 cation:proton antiporter subunit C [Methanocellales archaeon]MDD5484828.1 cation:proton antiporter subunit C [Methanocellales archaeon]
MVDFGFLLGHYNYWAVVVLFLIGLYAMVVKKNLIKKFMGLNIMDTSIFLFYISMGDVEGGVSPIIAHEGAEAIYVNPLPSVLILTAIVVAVSTTALALSLIIRIYEEYGTLDSERLVELM